MAFFSDATPASPVQTAAHSFVPLCPLIYDSSATPKNRGILIYTHMYTGTAYGDVTSNLAHSTLTDTAM